MTEEPDKPDVAGQQVEAFEPLPGDLLVGARRARGLSVAKVAEALNLDASVVLALEENRFENLGAPVFARGHLRKYARLLSLDPDAVLRAYDAITPEVTEQASTALRVTPAVEKARPRAGGSRVLWFLGVLALAALAVVLWRLLDNGKSAAPAAGDQSEAEVIDVRPTTGEARIVIEDIAREAEAPEDAEVPEPDAGRLAENGAPVPEESAAPATGPDRAAPAEAVQAPTGTGRLVFTFEQDSWLDVQDAQGRRLAYELGRRGTRRTINGEAPFEIFLGNWNGVSMTLDGRSVAVPEVAKRGNTARFSISGPAVD